MQKILFDPEDFPPPSYYLGNELNEDIGKQNEDEETKFENNLNSSTLVFGHEKISGILSNSQLHDVAPVHQSLTKSMEMQKSDQSTSKLNKSEWWKAPEFVPRNTTVQMVQNDEQKYNGSGPEISTFTNANHNADSSIPLQHTFQAHTVTNTRSTPILHPRMPPHMVPVPLTSAVISAFGQAPTPFIHLPMAMPATPAWALHAPQNPNLQFNPTGIPSLASLQNQLSKTYMHNPRVIKGQNPTSAAIYNQKLQQLILQRENQSHNRFYHRNHHPVPFMAPLTSPASKVPAGFKINMTTIDAGLGGPIPAIVLKRKRKKKNKKSTPAVGDGKQQSHTKQTELSQGPLGSEVHKEESVTGEASKENSLLREDEEEEDDETTTSSLTSPALVESRRSEPDLTKFQHESHSTNVNSNPEHLIQQSCYYPSDLDSIQNSNHCVMITGSCPDLSSAQELIRNGTSDNSSKMMVSHYENPFLRDGGDQIDNRINQIDNYHCFTNQSDQHDLYNCDHEFEFDTNPVVKNAMRDLASDGTVKSKRVKDLNRQVIKDLNLEDKFRRWPDDEHSEPELDEDDTIFERLLKNENIRQSSAKSQKFETNPGKGQKSLREELEEGLMIFQNRGARNYDSLPQRDKDAMVRQEYSAYNSGIGTVDYHTAIVHSSRKHGDATKTELYHHSEIKPRSKTKCTIPRATYVENDMEHDEHMRITVNALDALDVDGADVSSAKSHFRSSLANHNCTHSSEDISQSRRQFSFPDLSLPQLTRSRNCCVLM